MASIYYLLIDVLLNLHMLISLNIYLCICIRYSSFILLIFSRAEKFMKKMRPNDFMMKVNALKHRSVCQLAFSSSFLNILNINILIFFIPSFSPSSDKDYNSFWHILRMVGFVLSFGNSCANPVALYCVSGAFRKHFNR